MNYLVVGGSLEMVAAWRPTTVDNLWGTDHICGKTPRTKEIASPSLLSSF